MQLPNMVTERVRVQLDVTYDPVSDDWSICERQWRYDSPYSDWRLEEMYTSGTPLSNREAATRLLALARSLCATVQQLAPPFGTEPFPPSP